MAEPLMTRDGIESREATALRESAGACVVRLLQIGLPQESALLANEAVRKTTETMLQRQRAGEFEPR